MPLSPRQLAEAFADELGNISEEPKVDFHDWALKYLDNPDGTKFEFRPYQVLPAKLMFSGDVKLLSLRWASGIGKTYLLGGGFLYAVHQLREACAMMLPDVLAAEDWGRREFMPMHDQCGVVSSIGFAKGGKLIREKRWANRASLQFLGSNSAARMRRAQFGVGYADEIDAIKSDAGDEGDKLQQFWMRTRGRKRVHLWASSYPSLQGHSKIDTLVDESSLWEWVVDCAGCGDPWRLCMDDLTGTEDDPAVMCPNCKRLFDDDERREMSRAGRWEGGEMAGKVAFHLDAMPHVGAYDDAYPSYLHYLMEKKVSCERAENPEKAKRVFVNTVCAKSYEPPFVEKPDARTVMQRREGYDPEVEIPEGVLVIVMGCDVQKDRIEAEIIGRGFHGQSWGLGYKVLRGSPLEADVWKALKKVMETTFAHPCGKRVPISSVAIDTKYQPDHVNRFCRSHHRASQWVKGVRGAKAADAPIVGKATTAVGTQVAKSLIRARIALEPFADGSYPDGYCHYPETADYNSVYFDQLLAEEAELKNVGGELVEFFTCPPGKRNEAFDARVYGEWAYLAPNFDLNATRRRLYAKRGKPKAKRPNFATGF